VTRTDEKSAELEWLAINPACQAFFEKMRPGHTLAVTST
jgi:hypothetical protein